MEQIAPYTYSGLLDDVVERYPSGGEIGQGFFRHVLAKNIFFSGGVLINDGYLLNHPSSRKELLEPNSILRRMLDANFVRVLSRTGSDNPLVDTARVMAESRNETFVRLLDAPDWPEQAVVLTRLGQALRRIDNIKPWPDRQMHLGFLELMQPLFARNAAQLGLAKAADLPLQELAEAFQSRSPEVGNPRHHLEQAALTVTARRCRDPAGAMNEIMTLANQCYHYNFGMCLQAESQDPIAVDTSIGRAFDDILQLDEIEDFVLDRVKPLRIPRNLPFEDGSAFVELMSPTSTTGEAKDRYLSALSALFQGPRKGSDAAVRDLAEASDHYRRRLAEHFATRVSSRLWETWMDTAVTIGTGVLGEAIGAGPIGGVAIGVATTEALRRPRDFLLRRVRVRSLENEMDPAIPALEPSRYHEFKLAEIRPTYSSVAFNDVKAKAFASKVPRFSA